jgi:cobalamin biosynthesis protein CbiG
MIASTRPLHPPSLVVGVGAGPDADAHQIEQLIDAALADARLATQSIRHCTTVDSGLTQHGLRGPAG